MLWAILIRMGNILMTLVLKLSPHGKISLKQWLSKIVSTPDVLITLTNYETTILNYTRHLQAHSDLLIHKKFGLNSRYLKMLGIVTQLEKMEQTV